MIWEIIGAALNILGGVSSWVGSEYGWDTKTQKLSQGKSLANPGGMYMAGKASGETTGDVTGSFKGDKFLEKNDLGYGADYAGLITGMLSGASDLTATIDNSMKSTKPLNNPTAKTPTTPVVAAPVKTPLEEASSTLGETGSSEMEKPMGSINTENIGGISEPYKENKYLQTFEKGGTGEESVLAQGGEYYVTFDEDGNVFDYTPITGNKHTSGNKGSVVTLGKNSAGKTAILTKDQFEQLMNNKVTGGDLMEKLPLAEGGLTYDQLRTRRRYPSVYSWNPSEIDLSKPTGNLSGSLNQDALNALGIKPASINNATASFDAMSSLLSKPAKKTDDLQIPESKYLLNMDQKVAEMNKKRKQDKILAGATTGTNMMFAALDIFSNQPEPAMLLEKTSIANIPAVATRFMPYDTANIAKANNSYLKAGIAGGLTGAELSAITTAGLEAINANKFKTDLVNMQGLTETDKINTSVASQNATLQQRADEVVLGANEQRVKMATEDAAKAKGYRRESGMKLAAAPIEAYSWLNQMDDKRTQELQNYYVWLGMSKDQRAALLSGYDPSAKAN